MLTSQQPVWLPWWSFLKLLGGLNAYPELLVRSSWNIRGGSRISGKGVHIHKVVCVGRLNDFFSFFLNIP